MVHVYRVDTHTRLHLPDTNWASQVIGKLRELGYTVELTQESVHPDTRDEAELERRDCLLAETGL